MAIFDIYLEIDKDYIKLINDIYKISVILIVLQLIISMSNINKNIINNSLNGSIMNDDFMTLLIYIIISILAYYLIFDRIISFY
jgi:hypothetical protein